MADKPVVYPEWASDDVQDPISLQYNVVEPTLERKKVGWLFLEKPNRQFWNWLHRVVYDWIVWLDQQESLIVTTDDQGVGLFTKDDALITIKAVDLDDSTNFYQATGIKTAGNAPSFSPGSIVSNGLTLGVGTTSGNQPILGGSRVVITGESRLINP